MYLQHSKNFESRLEQFEAFARNYRSRAGSVLLGNDNFWQSKDAGKYFISDIY
jgi:hypothetical protein